MQCWEREDGRKLQRVDSELDEQWSRAPGKDPRHSSWLGPLNLDHKAQGFSGLFIYKPRGDTLLAVSGRKAVCFKVTCISKMWTLDETLNDINVWAGCVGGGGGGRKLSTLKFRMTIWIWSYRTSLFPPPPLLLLSSGHSAFADLLHHSSIVFSSKAALNTIQPAWALVCSRM